LTSIYSIYFNLEAARLLRENIALLWECVRNIMDICDWHLVNLTIL